MSRESKLAREAGARVVETSYERAILLDAMGQDGRAMVAARTAPGTMAPGQTGPLVGSGSGT